MVRAEIALAMKRTSEAKQLLSSQEKELLERKTALEKMTKFTREQRRGLSRRQRQLIEAVRKKNLALAQEAQKQFQQSSISTRQAIERSSQAIDEALKYEYGRKLAGKGFVDTSFTKIMKKGYREGLARIKQSTALKGLGGFQTVTGEIQYVKPSGEVVYQMPSPVLFSPSTIAPTTEAMPRVESAGLSSRAIGLKEKLIRTITPPLPAPYTPVRGGIGSVAYVLPSGERVRIKEAKIPQKPLAFKDISWAETFGKTTSFGKRIDIPDKVSLGKYIWSKYGQAVSKIIDYRDTPRVGKPPIFQVSPEAKPVIETAGRIIPDVSKWLFFTPAMATTPATLQQLISRGAKPVGETIFVSTVKKVPKGIEIQTGARTQIGGETFTGRTTVKGIQLKKLQLTAGEGWIRRPPRMDITQIKVAGVVERLGKAKEIFLRPTYQITKEAGKGFRGVVGVKEIVRKELYAPKVITTKLGVRTKQPFLGVIRKLKGGVYALKGTSQPLFFRGKGIIPEAEIKGILTYVKKGTDGGIKISRGITKTSLAKTFTPQVQEQIAKSSFEQATGIATEAGRLITKEATKGAIISGSIPTGFGAIRSIIQRPSFRVIPDIQYLTPFPSQPQAPKITTIQPQIPIQRSEQILGLSQEQRLKQKQLLEQEAPLLQFQPFRQGLRQVQIPSFSLGVKQVQIPTPNISIKKITTPTPPPTPFGFIGEFISTFKETQAGDVPAYRIWVKRKGRKVFLTGKYPRGEAIKIGARRTRQTLRATFGIVEKGRLRVRRREPSFTPSPEVFRTYRIVKGKRVPLKDVWIQKAPQRLKAKSEIKEILRVRKQKKKKGGRKMRWF